MAEYVIYDEFHWGNPDHLESPCANYKEALERYKFLKESFPNDIFGLTTKKKFLKLKELYKQINKTTKQ